MAKNPIQSNHYYVINYDGKHNGELMLAKVTSVRRNGSIQLMDMLTGRDAHKTTKEITEKYKRINAEQANTLLSMYNDTKDKRLIRKAGIAMPLFEGRFAMDVAMSATTRGGTDGQTQIRIRRRLAPLPYKHMRL